MSTLVGHFMSSPREREKRDRRDSRGDEREGQGRNSNRNESEETEEIKTFLYPCLLQGQQALLNCKPISFIYPDDKRYMTPLPHFLPCIPYQRGQHVLLQEKMWAPLPLYLLSFKNTIFTL